jgi:hypothetical protein
MADAIHPSMHTMQPTADAAVLGGPGTEANRPQLRQRHDTMLARRQLGHRRIQRERAAFAKVTFVDAAHPLSVGWIVLRLYAAVLRISASPSKMRPTPGRSPGVGAR